MKKFIYTITFILLLCMQLICVSADADTTVTWNGNDVILDESAQNGSTFDVTFNLQMTEKYKNMASGQLKLTYDTTAIQQTDVLGLDLSKSYTTSQPITINGFSGSINATTAFYTPQNNVILFTAGSTTNSATFTVTFKVIDIEKIKANAPLQIELSYNKDDAYYIQADGTEIKSSDVNAGTTAFSSATVKLDEVTPSNKTHNNNKSNTNKTQYKVEFEPDNGSSRTVQTITKNGKVSKPNDPTKEGYTFIGWFVGNSEYIFSDPVTSNFTLVAKWEKNEDTKKDDSASLPEKNNDTESGTQTSQNPDESTENTAENIGYISGYEDGTFRPENNMTRAEAAVMLYNLLSSEEKANNKPSVLYFTDINKDDWYCNAVATLAQADIIRGYEENNIKTFAPNQAITRAEYAALIIRFNNLKTNNTTDKEVKNTEFTDVPENHWAKGYISAAAQKEWITGYENGEFHPESNMSRAEIVASTNRMLKLSDKTLNTSIIKDDMNKFSDNNKDSWYYKDIILATATAL